MSNDRSRRPNDPWKNAEAAFKPAVPKPAAPPAARPAVPGAKEMVSIRLDRDVLDFYQKDGPGWQDRINAVLREASGVGKTKDPGKHPDELNAENDG